MVIEVVPHERDETGLSHLTISYPRGRLETPERLVNRNDLNAKSVVGAELGVTTGGRPFVYDLEVSPQSLYSIRNTNEYLGEICAKVSSVLGLVYGLSLRIVHARLTRPLLATVRVDENARRDVARFLIALAAELRVDAFVMQSCLLSDADWRVIDRNGTPVVPFADIHSVPEVDQVLEVAVKRGASNVPLIGVSHAIYRRAYVTSNRILDAQERLHDQGFGILVLGAPRILGGEDPRGHDISAPHYSAFLMGDVVGQAFAKGGPHDPSTRLFRVFERADLEARVLAEGHDATEHGGEDAPFARDPELDRLFWRTMRFANDANDGRDGRVPAILRLHEVVASGQEFAAMRSAIMGSELVAYRESKGSFDRWLASEGREQDPRE